MIAIEAGILLRLVPGFLVAVLTGSLAVVVLRARGRDRANLALSAFLGLVSANYLIIAIADYLTLAGPTPPTGRTGLAHDLTVLAFSLQILDPVALVLFAAWYPRPVRRILALVLPVAGVALAFEAWLLLDPVPFYTRGPAANALEIYLGAVYLGALARWLNLAFTDATAAPLPWGFLLGWVVLVVLRVADLLRRTLVRAVVGPPGAEEPWAALRESALTALSAAALLVILWAIYVRPRVPSFSASLRPLIVATGACGGILLTLQLGRIAWIASDPAQPASHAIRTLQGLLDRSFWESRWIFLSLVAGPAFLRNQIIPTDVELRRALVVAVAAGGLLIAAVVCAAVVDASIEVNGSLGVRTFLFVLAAGAIGSQSIRIARNLADRVFPIAIESDEAYRRLRRFEMYRDAVEAVASGRASAEGLSDLRLRLGLSEAEAKLAQATSAIAPTDAALAPGLLLQGRYELLEVVDKASHGRVFRARDHRTSEEVAVKETAAIRSSDALRLMEAEIHSANRLQAPGIVPVLDCFMAHGAGFLVLPLMRGGSLERRLRERGPMEPREAARTASEILKALGAAHARGIVHRDVKPGNILLDDAGRAWLSDFGVARIEAIEPTAAPWHGAAVAGTPTYLPPDAFDGGPPTPAWDTYAVGTVLLRALGNGSIPTALRAVIDRARAPASDRYERADEMRDDLDRFLRS